MSVLLEVGNLEVEIPTSAGLLRAVRGVSFAVNKGEILCIVGESGCGKSLTSLALMGLLPRRARRRVDLLRFAGQDLTGASRRQLGRLRGDRIAMIFQDPGSSLNPVFKIGDQLTEVFLRHRGGSRDAARERAIALLVTCLLYTSDADDEN